MVIYKTEDSEGFWDKLQKGARPNFLKVDFAKWRDEDDEDEDAQADPMAGMGGPQGAGGMPDMSSLMGGGGAGGMDFSQLLNSADFNNMVRNRRGWKGYLGTDRRLTSFFIQPEDDSSSDGEEEEEEEEVQAIATGKC